MTREMSNVAFFPREKLLALEEVTPIAYHNWISVGQRKKEKRERE